MGSVSKKGHLPVSRISTIMKSSSDVDTVGKISTHLMSKATELFIKNLALEGYKTSNNAKKLDYKHLAEVVHNSEKYNFLRDIMPKKITVLEYRKIMERKEKMNNDDNSSKRSSSESSSSDNEEDSSTDESNGSSASA